MTVTIKLMMIILLWNNDGSFESKVSEVTECPERRDRQSSYGRESVR